VDRNCTGERREVGAEEGDGFGRVTGAVSSRLQNCIHPRRSETDMWGPQGTGARLAAIRGRKMARAGLEK
jgi:hypothetical protein